MIGLKIVLMTKREESFLQRINTKQPEAFRELFSEFYNSLVLFAMGFVEQQDVAEDIVQEVFIAVWERDAQYPTYNAFRSFLYNSVKNAGLNHLKHKNVEEKYLASLNLEDEGDDIDLKMNLMLHMIPFLERVRNQMMVHNPIINDIKEKYSFAYELASIGLSAVCERLKVKITEDEISFFALHFILALERKREEVAPSNILIVCSTGRATSQLLA